MELEVNFERDSCETTTLIKFFFSQEESSAFPIGNFKQREDQQKEVLARDVNHL